MMDSQKKNLKKRLKKTFMIIKFKRNNVSEMIYDKLIKFNEVK